MGIWTRLRAVLDRSRGGAPVSDGERSHAGRLRTDGGERRDRNENEESETTETDEDSEIGGDASNVEVTESGEAEPAEPKWDRVDPDDIPEFEIRANQLAGVGRSADDASADDQATASPTTDRDADSTAGRPNTARSPGQSRIKQGGTEGYIVALELCARLPEDVRLPDEAADLVPAAVEAELEEDIRAFAAAEFETASPSVETLSFVEVDDEIWMRLRLGISPDAFADLDPDEIRTHALQQLEGLF
jgi:hypothetical protein